MECSVFENCIFCNFVVNSKYDTWEPENNLTHCKKEVKAFEERLKEKKAQGEVTVTTPPSDEGTSTSLCEQITDDESSEEDDCVFDAQLYQNLEQWVGFIILFIFK